MREGGGRLRPENFASVDAPNTELLQFHLYTWSDCSLREIVTLLQSAEAPLSEEEELTLAFVFPDRGGKMLFKEAGTLHAANEGADDSKTLRQLKFRTGDYVFIRSKHAE